MQKLSISVADLGSGIRCLFDPWIRDRQKSRSGSGMNIPDHIFENLDTIFWVKILKFCDADPESGSRNLYDPESGIWDGKNRDKHTRVC
jgi:hypothetical protein